MLIGIAVLLGMVLIAYLIFLALNGKFPRPHVIFYLLSAATALYTYIYFLFMGVDFGIKIAVSVLLGAGLLFLGSRFQRGRRQS